MYSSVIVEIKMQKIVHLLQRKSAENISSPITKTHKSHTAFYKSEVVFFHNFLLNIEMDISDTYKTIY